MTVRDLLIALRKNKADISVSFRVPSGADYAGLELDVEEVEEVGKSDTCPTCGQKANIKPTRLILKVRG